MNDATETAASFEAGRLFDCEVTRPAPRPEVVLRAVTAIMGTVVGLTFLFGFGNVLSHALRLGVPVWVAPLVAPAVDLSILGLLLGTWYLALTGASSEVLAPARRLLIFASVVTLALNVAEPLIEGKYGKAAFDAVGPLLLIGWSEVGPGLLQAINTARPVTTAQDARPPDRLGQEHLQPDAGHLVGQSERRARRGRSLQDLLVDARREDTAHRVAHQKPISADSLRVRLGVGAKRARQLAKIVRSEFEAEAAAYQAEGDMDTEERGEAILAA